MAGGLATGGTSQAGKKRDAHSINLDNSNPAPSNCPDLIIFVDKDMKAVNFPHSDVIIIKENISGAEVRRILVDSGSS